MEQENMLQIGNTIVSLDVVEKEFICNLNQCLGVCCIEGDAGAPITEAEHDTLRRILPEVWDDLLPAAREVINEHGVAYIDEEGDLVTSIVNGKDCVFTCYEKNGMCKCAIEKAYKEGRIDFYKPVSCHLYPVRVEQYGQYTAVNYHKWKICKAAEILGRKDGVKVYQFLRDPLIRRFGSEWYQQLELTAEEFSKTR